jgi:hypothetical protein
MFIEMSCKCGALMQLEGLNDTYTMLMTNRFVEAHVQCGFVTPVNTDQPQSTRRDTTAFKPKAFTEDDED